MASSTERRRRLRVKLAWTARLAKDRGGHAVESRTVDVSSSGFYCISDEIFPLGEYLWCQILAPTRNPFSREEYLCLECRVEVVRVDRLDGTSRYGVGCRIDDYCVAPLPLDLTRAHAVSSAAGIHDRHEPLHLPAMDLPMR
jgi:hypothetical protein